MEKRIQEAINNQASSEYILPFFWQHGEEHSVLAKEIDAIRNAGIREFCVESRPHEQFGEEQWWQDMDFLLQEAQKRNMRVWLLDDKAFPTGYANNYIADHPELRALKIRMDYRDFAGPQKQAAILPVFPGEGHQFVSIVAFRRTQEEKTLCGDGIQLLPRLEHGLIWWDIPEGLWRVYYISTTHEPAESHFENYIDVLSRESCRAMIHAVYQPHYEHFREYFGNTFAGFFSDEPGFKNESGYDSCLGREGMNIPWSEEMLSLLAGETGFSGEKIRALLPALWHDCEGASTVIRTAYMEVASRAYSRNFGWMLGDWCREHGVMYIGHVIEDNNAHQRLGYGAGHFFRALDGQDMGGCDIVLHEVIPGHTRLKHTAAICGGAEPAFFHYTLPKLASSHAHIQPLKKGRAMCEIYGAFGWAEGIWQMKYLTDLMLAGGINYFVPHAFTPKDMDEDCPPHFYAGGRNPQYPLFGSLMEYTGRMAHVLTGGIHQADVAVYYNAEAEWAGGRRMLQQEVCSLLTQHQIDYDLLPQDTVCSDARVKEGRLVVNEETYGALVIPYSQYLPERLLKTFSRLAAQGLPLWFIEDLPEATSEGHEPGGLLRECHCVPLEELPEILAQRGLKSVHMKTRSSSLRFFHVRRDGYDVFMLWNEDIFEEIDEYVDFSIDKSAVFYDGWKNEMFRAEQRDGRVRVGLAPSQAVVLCFGDWEDGLTLFDYGDRPLKELDLPWRVAIRRCNEQNFTGYPLSDLHNLAREIMDFSGIIRYETIWNLSDPEAYSVMELERVGETAQLWINGEDCGTVVGKPYRFSLKEKLKKGENHLCIEVVSNLGYERRDFLSTWIPLPPMGIAGAILVG